MGADALGGLEAAGLVGLVEALGLAKTLRIDE